ncbi:quinone-dependent dihydroorotate dehydrogenase [Agaribacterium haliotis]|uniref:quinone-dependent dihydroorotate dehydrogenase n=1 Tax=Agaribacterium haliotis TaxID=2013869 RepID=UPI000BB58404|nr:quinone-dependent dihydroorotate dehydrogenase [Agaribacterium haliotis]
MSLYDVARRMLFLLDPETAHEVSLDMMSASERLKLIGLLKPSFRANKKTVMGLQFPNPVGLAAGMDKNGDHFNALGGLGFGFIEIGTVTPVAQAGNEQPRLFRLPEHQAIINRMGFNNKGVDYLVNQVRNHRRFDGVLGINIGKNKLTADEDALSDYQTCMDKVYDVADYIAINISSPNTPGLRGLQFGDALDRLIAGIADKAKQLADDYSKKVPIAVKLAPDTDDEGLKFIADTLQKYQMDGVIATNTTVSRSAVSGHKFADEAGGLSGKPLTQMSTEVIAKLRSYLGEAMPIIGVGGIENADDAKAKIDAGADLLQVYSGFIYRGPALIKDVNAAFDPAA